MTSLNKSSDLLHATRTEDGIFLADLSADAPVLAIFLRHSGCTFCRQTLSDLAHVRSRLDAAGVKVVLVHMSPVSEFSKTLTEYRLDGVRQISDPDRKLYREFGLQRGRVGQLLGWRAWWHGFLAAIIQRHGVGRMKGDVRQMPGVFLIQHGKLVKELRHAYSSDRPDLLAFVSSKPDSAERQ